MSPIPLSSHFYLGWEQNPKGTWLWVRKATTGRGGGEGWQEGVVGFSPQTLYGVD